MNLKDSKGFTLIEISIGLMLLGLLAVALILPYQLYQKNKVRATNDATFEAITEALASYLERTGHYPPPADRRLGPSNSNFGCGSASVGCAGAGVGPDSSAPGVLIGAVPVRDLNLPYRMIGDAFGSKLTYAVTTVLTTSSTSYDSAGGAGAVTVNMVNNTGAAMAARTAQFILVSHGADMKGAYPINGASSVPVACGTTARDIENCDNNETFLDQPQSPRATPTDSNHYDDTVSYTLLRKETTMWKISENSGAGGGVNISNRNMANVGIGTATPSAKLHISGGDLEIQKDSTPTGGGSMNVTGSVSAQRDVKAKVQVRASNFSGISTP